MCLTKRRRLRYCRTPEGYLRRLVSQLKSRRRNQFIKINFTSEDVLDLYHQQDGRCAITGVRMTHIASTDGLRSFSRNPHNISIDRKRGTKPYVLDNIQLVCKRINLMKHTMSEGEFKLWCKRVIRHQT